MCVCTHGILFDYEIDMLSPVGVLNHGWRGLDHQWTSYPSLLVDISLTWWINISYRYYYSGVVFGVWISYFQMDGYQSHVVMFSFSYF